MNQSAVIEALQRYLEGMTDCPPIAWEDGDFDPTASGQVPYVEFTLTPSPSEDDSIDGSFTVMSGIVLATVIDKPNQFGKPAQAIADAIVARFHMGLRIAATGGAVVITKPSDPVRGFVANGYYRVPVRISYRTAPPIA